MYIWFFLLTQKTAYELRICHWSSDVCSSDLNLFRLVRAPLCDALCSAICFSYERPVAFLDEESEQVERVFGYLMIVEKADYVAVLKSGLDVPSAFKTLYLGKVSNERVERAVAREGAIFEQLRLKNMSTSKLALRSKSFEASDLQNRSEEHTSELQSLMRISYAVFCLKKKQKD